MLTFLLFASFQAPVPEGLRDGEVFRLRLAGGAETSEREPFVTRVLDAETGKPIAHALLEAWTEQLDHEALLVERAVSGSDGVLELDGGVFLAGAEKLLVRAPGYRSTVETFDDEELYLLRQGVAPRVRVLDLEDRPIGGALVRTHQSCAHAPAAASTRTDADGWASLPDLPALWHNADYEFTAPRHGGLMYVSQESLLACDGAARGQTVWLPRRDPVELRLLDAGGQPFAGRRAVLVLGVSAAWQAAWTDASGRVRFGPPAGGREVHIELRDGEERTFVAAVELPRAGEVTLRVDGEHPPEELATARLVVTAPELELEAGKHRIQAFHEDGWVAYGAGAHALPPGRVRVVSGLDFTGVRETERSVALAAGETTRVALEPVHEAVLALELPDEKRWTVHVQAGDASITLEDTRDREVTVPAGREVTVLAIGRGVWRVRLLAPEREARVVLAQGECLVPANATFWPGPRSTRVTLAPVDDHGRPVADVDLRLYTRVWPLEDLDQDDDPTTREYDLPAGLAVESILKAPGHVRRAYRFETPRDGVPVRFQVELTRRASVSFTGGVAAARAAGVKADPDDAGGLRLQGLAPGPLRVELVLESGHHAELDLVLEAGEERALSF